MKALQQRKYVDMISKFLGELDLLRVNDNVGVMSWYGKDRKGASVNPGASQSFKFKASTKNLTTQDLNLNTKLRVLLEVPTYPEGWLSDINTWPSRDASSALTPWSHLTCKVQAHFDGNDDFLKKRGYRFVSALPGLNHPAMIEELLEDDIDGEILDNPNMRSMVDSMENVGRTKIWGQGIDVMLIIYVSHS